MAENNITSMVITVVISMVVVGAVMIPIFNGIVNNGDGGGGDVSGAYQYGAITIQTLDELTSILENPPELRTEYNGDETEISVISDGEVVATVPINETGSNTGLLPLEYYRYTLMLSPEGVSTIGAEEIHQKSWTYLVYGGGYGDGNEIVTVSKSWVENEGDVVYEVDRGDTGITPDGYDVFVEGEMGMVEEVVSLIEDVDMEIIYLQKSGEYVYVEDLDFNDLSSEVIVMGYNSDLRWESPADWDDWVVVLGYSGMIGGLTSDTVTYATSHNETGAIHPTAPLGITSTNPISVSVEFEDDHVSTFTIDSAIIPIGGSGGGSSGDNDLGTAGIIIGVIPIFVVLGILVGVTQYFRAGKNGL